MNYSLTNGPANSATAELYNTATYPDVFNTNMETITGYSNVASALQYSESLLSQNNNEQFQKDSIIRLRDPVTADSVIRENSPVT